MVWRASHSYDFSQFNLALKGGLPLTNGQPVKSGGAFFFFFSEQRFLKKEPLFRNVTLMYITREGSMEEERNRKRGRKRERAATTTTSTTVCQGAAAAAFSGCQEREAEEEIHVRKCAFETLCLG